MFAANNKISSRGIRKLILINELGVSLLFAIYFSGHFDLITGTLLLTFIFGCSYVSLKVGFRLLQKISQHRLLQKPLHRRLLQAKVSIRAFILAIFVILALLELLHEQILPGTNAIFLLLVIFGTALCIGRQSIEVRSRFCELLYPFVLIPIIITIAYSYATMDYPGLVDILPDIAFPEYALTFRNVLKLFLTGFFSYIIVCPWEYLLVNEPFCKDPQRAQKTIEKTGWFLYGLCVLEFVAMKVAYPVEPIFPMIVSFIFYIATSLHYGMPAKKSASCTYCVAIPVFTTLLLLAPAILQSTHLYTYLSRLNFSDIHKPDTAIVDARELENRCFVLSLRISELEGELQYNCELANRNYDSTAPSDYVVLEDLESYMLAGGKPLDFSHIHAIVLENEVTLSIEELSVFAEEYRIPDTTLIFMQKDFPNLYASLVKQEGELHLGKVLDTIAKNQNVREELMLRNVLEGYD